MSQPADTTVATPTGLAPIHTLRDGDLVISYDPASTALRVAGMRIRMHFHDGPLYQVIVAGKATWCCRDQPWSTRLVGSDKTFIASTLDLEPEEMELPIPNGQSIQWRYIDAVNTELYTGKVYTLEAAHNEHYIADGIVTHNSPKAVKNLLENTQKYLLKRATKVTEKSSGQVSGNSESTSKTEAPASLVPPGLLT